MANKKLRLASLYKNFKNIRFEYGEGPASKGVRDFINHDLKTITQLNRGLLIPIYKFEDPNNSPILCCNHQGGEIDHRDLSYKSRDEILQIIYQMIEDSQSGFGESNFVTKYKWSVEDIVDASDDYLEIISRIRSTNLEDGEISEKIFTYGRIKNVPLQYRPTRGDIEPPYEEYDIL